MIKKQKKVNNIGYQFLRPLCKLFIILVASPKTIHKERIPKEGGFLYAGTHLSYIDPFIVGNTTKRSVHFLSKIELSQNPILRPFMRIFGVIPVDRKKKNPEAKEAAVEALKDGNVICIFPEGTRNLTGKPLMPFKYGAVSFAYKSGKPIIPFAIVGGPKTFNYKVKIIIGKPFYVKSDNLEKENKKLEQIVLDLIKEGNKYVKNKKSL